MIRNPFPEPPHFVFLSPDVRSSGKGKTQIGMAKFHALRGFGEISTPAEGGSISPKKLCESNSATFLGAAGTNKR